MKFKLLLFVAISMLFFSCSKDEGYGGLATISGKIYGKDFNSNGNLVSEDYLGGVKVYIAPHGSTSPFDSVDSAYDGSFRFEYLHEGTYDIWVFGDCDSCPWDQTYELRTVELTSKRANVIMEDIIITF
uniref:hypothetical protein n=1 Tax=Flavobacterium sp. TaxID=239 RepID=UPI00404A3057